tara:strand:- start:182 stop:388 length:207 start_codon:yes stop_codon:yes gene_type:complete
MQNQDFRYNKYLSSENSDHKNIYLKSNNVDINRLLNRVKKRNTDEIKKKLILLSLAMLSIIVTGLIVF